jgi:hypothetical protein
VTAANGTSRVQTVGNGGRGGDGAPKGTRGGAGANGVVGPIDVTVAPVFQPGGEGTDCTPPQPQQVFLRIPSITNSGGVVASGTQSVALEVNNEARGTIPVVFTAPTFVGSSPNRIGIGAGGSVILRTGEATVDGTPYDVGRVQACLVNAPTVSPSNPVVVQKRDANNAVVSTTNLTAPSACYDSNNDSFNWFAIYFAATAGGLDLRDFVFGKRASP